MFQQRNTVQNDDPEKQNITSESKTLAFPVSTFHKKAPLVLN